MGRYLLIFSLISLSHCASSKKPPIVGIWQVNSRFYAATYEIEYTPKYLQAQVLFYDDGTTHYQYQGGIKQYLFQDLHFKNNQYLDGMSSATQQKPGTAKKQPQFKIKPKGNDTLEVTSYVRQRPLVEHWVRKQSD